MRKLNRKRKAPAERSTNVKMPRVKDEKIAAESLLLLSEPAKELEMNMDDLLVVHVLCSLGDMSSANAQLHSQTKTINLSVRLNMTKWKRNQKDGD